MSRQTPILEYAILRVAAVTRATSLAESPRPVAYAKIERAQEGCENGARRTENPHRDARGADLPARRGLGHRAQPDVLLSLCRLEPQARRARRADGGAGGGGQALAPCDHLGRGRGDDPPGAGLEPDGGDRRRAPSVAAEFPGSGRLSPLRRRRRTRRLLARRARSLHLSRAARGQGAPRLDRIRPSGRLSPHERPRAG